MKRAGICLTILLCAYTSLSADIYIKQKLNTDPVTIKGKTTPATEQISETWINKNKFATILKDTSIIVDLEKNTIIQMNHKKKVFLEMTIPIELSKYFPENVATMMEMMIKSTQISVNSSGKSKTINNWECQGYEVMIQMDLMGMPIHIEMIIWACTEVPFDWKMVNEKMTSQILKMGMKLTDDALEKIQKIQGYAISIESSINMLKSEIKSVTQVIEISNKSPKDNIYTIPQGYTKKEKLSLQDLHG